MSIHLIMLGATGAVGTQVVKHVLDMPEITRITLLGRRVVDDFAHDKLTQHVVDVTDPSSYEELVQGHDSAICTLGVGEPSKVSKNTFVKIDHDVVLDFGKACKTAGVAHFELLSSVGVSPTASSFYLRTKGRLEESLKALDFERLSLFHPSMILTPENRYGRVQGLTLLVWPKLHWAMRGRVKKLRGVRVEDLGQSIAKQLASPQKNRIEVLEWSDFKALQEPK